MDTWGVGDFADNFSGVNVEDFHLSSMRHVQTSSGFVHDEVIEGIGSEVLQPLGNALDRGTKDCMLSGVIADASLEDARLGLWPEFAELVARLGNQTLPVREVKGAGT